MTQQQSEPLDPRLEKLNQFTRRTHTLEEVFLFDVKLCDNEIDRDGERFSLNALEQLKTLFIGRTGIFDHDPRGENQSARIYDTELVEEPERITANGEPLYISQRTRLYGPHRCQPRSHPRDRRRY